MGLELGVVVSWGGGIRVSCSSWGWKLGVEDEIEVDVGVGEVSCVVRYMVILV